MSQDLLLTRAALLSPGEATDDTRRSSVPLLQLFSVPIRIARLRPIHQLHRLVQELLLPFPVRAAFQLAALFGGRVQVVGGEGKPGQLAQAHAGAVGTGCSIQLVHQGPDFQTFGRRLLIGVLCYTHPTTTDIVFTSLDTRPTTCAP